MEKYRQDTVFKGAIKLDARPIGMPFYLSATGENTSPRGRLIQRKGVLCQTVQIIWGISGIGEVTLFGEKYQLRENEVFYYLPGEDVLRQPLSETWRHRWLSIQGGLAEAIMLSYRYPRHQRASSEYPEELFRELDEIISLTDPRSLRHGCSIVLEIFGRMGEGVNQGIHSEKTVPYCLEFISANLSDPQLGLAMLSDTLKVPRSTLSRLFTEVTGVSPGRYILDRRHLLAMSLLQGTDLRISEVAKRCGFAELRSFSRFIRRITGLGPREFRKKLQEAN